MQQKQLIKWLLIVTVFLCSHTFIFAITTTWQGTVDSDWTNAANWNNGVPTAADDARVLPSANDPEINGSNEKALSLVVRDGAVLTITGAGKLTVELSSANGVVIRDGGEIVVDDGQLIVKNATNNGIRIADGTLTVNANGQVKSNDSGANGILVADDGTVVNDGDVQVNNASINGIRNVINNVPTGLIDYSGAGTWKIDVTGTNGVLNFVTQTPNGEINFQHDGTLKIIEAGANGIFNHFENGGGEINFTSNGELTIKSPADFTNGSGIVNRTEANNGGNINFENNAPITIALGPNSNHGILNDNFNSGGGISVDFDANADITIKDVGGNGIYNFVDGAGGPVNSNAIRFIFSGLLKIKDVGANGMLNIVENVGRRRIFIVGEDDSNLEIINAGGRGILNEAYDANGSVAQGHVRISLNGTSLIKNPSGRGIDNYGDSGGKIWVRNQGVMTINGGTAGLFNETFNGRVEVINANDAEWYIKNTSGNSVRSLGNGGATRQVRNAGCAYMEVDNKIYTNNFLFLNQGILKTTFNGNNNTLGGGFPGEFRNNGLISDPDGVFTANPNGTTGGGTVQTDMPNVDVEITSMGSFMFCAGSSVDLAAGEFKILPNTYVWSTTETTQSIEVTAAGVYTVTITDDNGCTGTGTASVTEKPLPIPAFTGNTTNNNVVVCSEEMGVVYRLKDEDPDNKGTYGGAFPKYDNYVWSVTGGVISNKGGATDRSAHIDWPVGPALGSVQVTVTDDKGCTAATSLAVTISAPVMPTITGTFEYCAGSSTVIDAGMYAPTPNTYAWSSGATTQTLEVSTPGVYTVTVTNDNDCTGTATVDITENALPVPIFGNSTLNNSLLVCSEETDVRYRIRRELLGSGGTTYGGNNGGTKYDDYVWGVSSNGTISAAGGSNQRQAFVDWGVGPDMGGVFVTVTDDNGCVASTSVAVTISAPVMPTITGTFEYCAGSSTVIDAGMYAPTPNTYVWSSGATTQTLEVSTPGVYTVTVTNNDDCTGTATVDITENALPVPAFDNLTLNENVLVCSEEKDVRYALKREVLGSGGTYGGTKYDDYVWATSPNGLISGLGGATDRAARVDWGVGPDMGGVFVTVTDDNGCVASTSLAVTISAPVMPTITGTFEYCAGSSTVIDAGMYAPTPNTYVWSSGATTQTLEVSTPGVYTVTVTNDDDCTGTATVDITENALPVPLFNDNTLNNSLLVCSEAEDVEYKLKKEVLGSGGTYGGGASTKYADYQWVADNGTISGAGGATQRTAFVDWPVGPDMGAVLVTVTDDNGCVASTSVAVTVRAPLMPTITGDFEICPASPAFLDAGAYEFEPNTYVWSSGETTQTISTSIEAIYTVTVTDLLGCTGTATAETTDICDAFVTGLAHNGDTMCPGDDVVATVVDAQTSAFGHDYTLTYVLFTTNNLDVTTFYDSNDTGVFTAPPPGDYKICAYNELTDCQPDPSPNTSDLDSLDDVGTTTDGCYAIECSNFTVPEPFEFDFDNAELSTNVEPNGMNVYAIDICGGTPPYSLQFSSTPSNVFASVTQMFAGPDCRTIRVQYGDGAMWALTVEDSRGCSDDDSVVTYEDVVSPDEEDNDSIEENDDIVNDDRPSGRGRGRGRGGKTAQLETNGLSLSIAPNPFADFATIQFVTALAENASVDVYGMNGQHVVNLFEGQTTADSLQSVTFDGGTLQAGTYIVRLLTESGDLQYQKVVLMR